MLVYGKDRQRGDMGNPEKRSIESQSRKAKSGINLKTLTRWLLTEECLAKYQGLQRIPEPDLQVMLVRL